MPSYDYRCTACETEFEVQHPISDPPLDICPKCQNHTLVRVIGTTTFTLRGSGWAKDGYSSRKE